jgi:hypothetical protein|tara:strand:- start:1503 stop:1700 length:198 start_codon:yes stop_codon:yes gene_type:complete
MINEIATVDVLNLAIQKLNENDIEGAKVSLTSYKDKLQKEIDEFDKWAETQSDIDTQISLDFEGK